MVDAVLKTSFEPFDECDDSLASVSAEDKVRDAVECLKKRKVPGGDEITAEVLKLWGEEMQWLP